MATDYTTYRMQGGLLVPVALGYNATQSNGRRQAPQIKTTREDAQLSASDRAKIEATTADLWRNFELAKWMVSLHVAYVSRFDMLATTGHRDLDEIITDLFDWHGRKEQFDLAKRHDRNQAMALFEIAKVFCGDAAFIKLASGNLQGLPGKRIRWCDNVPGKRAPNGFRDQIAKYGTGTGLLIDEDTGESLSCVVCRWDATGKNLVFDHFEEWRNLLYDGYFVDMDQQRGISPIACAVNRLQDTYEAMEWVHLKIKLHSLFGIAFTRGATTGLFDTSTQTAAAAGTNPKYEVNPSKGVMVLDLDPGDDVKAIESTTPSNEFMDYSRLAMSVAMLALDMPYTMYDSSKASFSARIADTNQYEFLAADKRRKNRNVLKGYSDWKLAQWLNSPSPMFSLLQKKASGYGMSLFDLQRAVDWIGAETPWVDQLKQLEAMKLGRELYLSSPQRDARKRGLGPWYKIADEIEESRKRIASMPPDPSAKNAAPPAAAPVAVDDDPGDDDSGVITGKQNQHAPDTDSNE